MVSKTSRRQIFVVDVIGDFAAARIHPLTLSTFVSIHHCIPVYITVLNLFIWFKNIFSCLFVFPWFSEKNTLSFIETSALDSTNVEEAFKNILTGRKKEFTSGWVWYQPVHSVTSLLFFSPHRNLPDCISEANIRQIGTRRLSRQQRCGHQRPPNHGRTEGQQTPLLSKPVTLLFCVSLFLFFLPDFLRLSCCSHEVLTS